MIDFLFGIMAGVIGVYVYDHLIMKRTAYRPNTKDSKAIEGIQRETDSRNRDNFKTKS